MVLYRARSVLVQLLKQLIDEKGYEEAMKMLYETDIKANEIADLLEYMEIEA